VTPQDVDLELTLLFRILVLCVVMCSSSVLAMSYSDKQHYLDWINSIAVYDNATNAALAVASNGCWAAGYGKNSVPARKMALKRCKDTCKSSSCEIVDVDGASAFIKQRASSESSPTHPSKVPDTQSVWCATESFVQHFGNESHCRDVNGSSFDTQAAATKEHHRLKLASASTEPKPNYELAIELEFWKSVKDSDDPDMLQAYLDKYPNGKFSPLAKIKIKKLRVPGSND